MNFGRRRRQKERQVENERLGRMATRPSMLRAVVDDVNTTNGVLTLHLEHDPDLRQFTLPPVKGSLPSPGDLVVLLANGKDIIADPGPGALAPGRDWRSTDYIPGVQGWAIFANGDAEFNDIVARGDIDVIEGPDQATNGGFEEPVGGAVAAGPNLVPNGTFETDASGWSAVAAAVVRSTAQAHSGSASLRLTGSAPNSKAFSDFFDVDEDTEYELDFWVRAGTTGRSYTSTVNFRDADTLFIGSASGGAGTDISSSWRNAVATFTSPEGAASASILVEYVSVGVGEIHYIDDVVLRTPGTTGDIPAWEAASGCTVDRSSAQFHSGAASLEITSTGAGTGVAQAIPLVPVTPGDWWLLRSWNRTPQLATVQRAQWLDADLSVLSTDTGSSPTPVPNNTWTQLSDTFEAPDDAAYLVPQVAVTFSAGSQIVYIDDYEHRRIGAITAKIIPRGSIEGLDQAGQNFAGSGNLTGSFTDQATLEAFNDPGRAVKVTANCHFDARWVSTIAEASARLGISFDGGTTWSYSEDPASERTEPIAGDARNWASLTAFLSGVPSGEIHVRLEATTNSGTVRVRNITITAIMTPA